MEIEIKKDSWHARFLKHSYDCCDWQMPTNLCPYFWELVFLICMLPLTWWSYVIDRTNSRDFGTRCTTGFFCWLGLALSAGLGHEMLEKQLGSAWVASHWWALLVAAPLGLLFIAVTCAVIVGVLMLCIWLGQHVPEAYQATRNKFFAGREKPVKPQEPNVLFEYLKARKQKYCPQIKWK